MVMRAWGADTVCGGQTEPLATSADYGGDDKHADTG